MEQIEREALHYISAQPKGSEWVTLMVITRDRGGKLYIGHDDKVISPHALENYGDFVVELPYPVAMGRTDRLWRSPGGSLWKSTAKGSPASDPQKIRIVSGPVNPNSRKATLSIDALRLEL